MTSDISKFHNVRGCTPLSYRLIHFFLHSMMFLFALCRFIKVDELEKLFNFKEKRYSTTAEKYLIEHIKNDWKVIKELVGG